MQNPWQSCLAVLEKELPAQQLNTWIRPLVAEWRSPDSLLLVAPNRFVLQWVKERFLARIQQVATMQQGAAVTVNLALHDLLERSARPVPVMEAVLPERPSEPPIAPVAPASRPGAAPLRATPPSERKNGERSSLIPDFTFDNFVPGKANQLARAAAMQVAENPGTSYNPLFVYGGVGLGKTHLIHAVGNCVAQYQENAKVRYLHAAQYISDVVRAYQQKSFDAFKRYYHSLDLLLIDDIQFFTGKDRTQEEFFYAFNALIESHKQIIITCDTYPRDIAGIDERLKTRFSWGLTVALEPPEQEMRVAIILKKAEALGVALDEDIAFFVAKHIRSNVRELEGALKNVLAFARFTGKEPTVDVAREALKDLLSVHNRQISIDNIQKTVADFYKIKVSDLHSKKRTRNIARPRQMAMALAKELTEMSLPEIGDAFGNRDHTTVLHACRTIAALRSKSTELNREFHVLEQTLKG